MSEREFPKTDPGLYGSLYPEGPKHYFADDGLCIRCGTDAEEWEGPCIDELFTAWAEYLVLNDEVRAPKYRDARDRYINGQDDNAWMAAIRRRDAALEKVRALMGADANDALPLRGSSDPRGLPSRRTSEKEELSTNASE